MDWFNIIADAVYPPTCTGCGKYGEWLCGVCTNKLQPAHPECLVCRQVSNKFITHPHCKGNIDRSVIAWKYEQIARRIMKRFKYQYGYKTIEPLIPLLSPIIKSNFKQEENSVVIPVPLHRVRQLDRGFNQSEIISSPFKTALGMEVRTDLIRRKRYTESQVSKDKEHRVNNLKGAFEVSGEISDYKKVILVDDVLTTGATVQEVAGSIKEVNKDITVETFSLFRAVTKKAYSQTPQQT